MSERKLQKLCCQIGRVMLAPHGGIVVVVANAPPSKRNPVAGQINGEPDLIIILRGQAYGVELKAPNGKVEPHQARRHDEWKAASAPVFVARSVIEFEGIIRALTVGRQAA